MWIPLVQFCLVFSLLILTQAAFRPLDFDDSDYYLTVGPQVPPNALIENIRRGHEGLLVKLQELNRALKEDEVKMNNVFYQLGQHHNDLKSISTTVHKITDSSRSTDAKVSRQTYNVDFLRRNIEKISKEIENTNKKNVEVESLQETVNRLEDRLTVALSRLALLEGSSNANIKRSNNSNSAYYSARAPTFITKPASATGDCPIGWNVAGDGCYWVSGEEANYATAVSACVKLGAKLTGLPKKSNLHSLRKHMVKDKKYWTSATNAYSASSQWTFLMTGEPLAKSSWESSSGPWNYRTLHCAVLGRKGLVPARCSKNYKYICESN